LPPASDHVYPTGLRPSVAPAIYRQNGEVNLASVKKRAMSNVQL